MNDLSIENSAGSKILSDKHKTQWMVPTLTFLQRYRHDKEEFFDKIVTGVETWVPYETEEIKEQPNPPEAF